MQITDPELLDRVKVVVNDRAIGILRTDRPVLDQRIDDRLQLRFFDAEERSFR